MYKPSNNMPLNSFQVVSPCDNQTDFQAGQVIRFLIPKSIGFFDPHTSRVQFEVQVQDNNYKMCFASDSGVVSLIDMIRISQNGQVLEEITDYSTLNNVLHHYSDSLSIRQRKAVQNGAVDYYIDATNGSKTDTNFVLNGEPMNGDVSSDGTETNKSNKYQFELDCVGLFNLLSVVPSVALGDLLIEMRLVNTNQDALKIYPPTIKNPVLSTNFATGTSTVVLRPPFNVNTNGNGFNNLSDAPFGIDMRIRACDADGTNVVAIDRRITALAEDDTTGAITITMTPATDASENAKPSFTIYKGNDNLQAVLATTKFVVKKAELLLQVVRPPAQYVEALASKINEGMVLDLQTWTSYRNTLHTAVKNQTIDIPCFASRCKGLFTVPRLNQTPTYSRDGSTDRDLQGKFKNLKNYRTQIGETYYPNQPIALSQMLGGQHFSGQHIVELEKMLHSCNYPVRCLAKTKQDFIIPRVLAKYGATSSLVSKGARVYVEYNATTDPDANLDCVSFVCHINRVVISPNGVQVLS
tara:strand:- start:1068 stop:2642 length:1575 start_codon:yes stop_codon:yes gene_type:complete